MVTYCKTPEQKQEDRERSKIEMLKLLAGKEPNPCLHTEVHQINEDTTIQDEMYEYIRDEIRDIKGVIRVALKGSENESEWLSTEEGNWHEESDKVDMLFERFNRYMADLKWRTTGDAPHPPCLPGFFPSYSSYNLPPKGAWF